MKKRIGYIDALRGFSMILVVYSHVLGFSFDCAPAFSFNDIFVTFRMPLFFFLSGFFMYKPNRFTSEKNALKFLIDKFKVQIIPTLIFTLVFCLIFAYSFGELWMEKSKCGYWFTLTLFFYFLFYVLGELTVGRILRGKYKIAAGVFVAACVYAFSKFSMSEACPWANSFLCGLLGYANFQYFVFFFFGALIRACFPTFERLLDNKVWMLCFVLGFAVVQFLLQLPQSREWIIASLSFYAYSLLKSFAGFLGIVIVFACFRKYRSYFEDSDLGGKLQFVGARTLDIYLIHLILIRTDMRYLGEFISRHQSPVAELFLVTVASVLIIVVCLLISSVLRSSDVLAKTLFGKVFEKS